MIFSLRDLEIGKAYITEKETCLIRNTNKEVALGGKWITLGSCDLR